MSAVATRGFVSTSAVGPTPRCPSCRHFCNDPLALETAFAGLASLSSGYAAVRAQDGLCALHQRYVSARSRCTRHQVS